MTLRDVRNLLLAQMCLSLAAAVVIIALFESEAVMPGVIEKGSQAEFLLLTLMEMLTVCMIPAALRLFKTKRVRRDIASEPVRGLQRWGVVRMSMLCGTMVINILLYYITPLNVAFAYMAIICLISLVFINPTMRRCEAEAGADDNKRK